MRRIRIAQIGTSANSHGCQIFNSLKKQTEQFEIVGYALPENERKKFPSNIAVFDGYREMTARENRTFCTRFIVKSGINTAILQILAQIPFEEALICRNVRVNSRYNCPIVR